MIASGLKLIEWTNVNMTVLLNPNILELHQAELRFLFIVIGVKEILGYNTGRNG